jgi:SAM-dependent methyltransferase
MPDRKPAPIERLSFAGAEPHEAIEAAIHLSRYLLARPYCRGAKVLDAACGEGYGSAFMSRRWGAREVHGVDISTEAIGRARQLFGGEGITFHEMPVEELDATFEEGAFDAAVSLETIEHLSDPSRFLRSLRRAVRPGGAIVVSCPNDYWYYRKPEERNPFHVHKYTLEEFRELACAELGAARRWLFGTPVFGYANVGEDVAAAGRPAAGRMALMEARDALDALVVPPDGPIDGKNCSYFVGVWGGERSEEPALAGALYPCSMDAAVGAAQQAQAMRDEVQALRAKLTEAQDVERERRHAQLRLQAAMVELELLREYGGGGELRGLERELRQTIADQARLVDERDAYIKDLEARVNALQSPDLNRMLGALLRSAPRSVKDVAKKLLRR